MISDDNIYKINLKIEEGKLHILNNTPWSVFSHHFIIKDGNGIKSIEDYEFNSDNIWVHVENLPHGFVYKSNIESIASQMFEKFLEMNDLSKMSKLRNPIVKTRVRMDFTKPYPKGFWI